jgi:hypothetical protein
VGIIPEKRVYKFTKQKRKAESGNEKGVKWIFEKYLAAPVGVRQHPAACGN